MGAKGGTLVLLISPTPGDRYWVRDRQSAYLLPADSNPHMWLSPCVAVLGVQSFVAPSGLEFSIQKPY
jgi:hypothetical protein